jgi:hypothetical protein
MKITEYESIFAWTSQLYKTYKYWNIGAYLNKNFKTSLILLSEFFQHTHTHTHTHTHAHTQRTKVGEIMSREVLKFWGKPSDSSRQLEKAGLNEWNQVQMPSAETSRRDMERDPQGLEFRIKWDRITVRSKVLGGEEFTYCFLNHLGESMDFICLLYTKEHLP